MNFGAFSLSTETVIIGTTLLLGANSWTALGIIDQDCKGGDPKKMENGKLYFGLTGAVATVIMLAALYAKFK